MGMGEVEMPPASSEQGWRHSPDSLFPKERQNRPKMYPAWHKNAYPGNYPVPGPVSPGSRNKNASDLAQCCTEQAWLTSSSSVTTAPSQHRE
uniref:Uncharacterized protein n=1 Tax=Serinus canaria TaxID=9135 RepID=A0A8C9MWD1_SERCA